MVLAAGHKEKWQWLGPSTCLHTSDLSCIILAHSLKWLPTGALDLGEDGCIMLARGPLSYAILLGEEDCWQFAPFHLTPKCLGKTVLWLPKSKEEGSDASNLFLYHCLELSFLGYLLGRRCWALTKTALWGLRSDLTLEPNGTVGYDGKNVAGEWQGMPWPNLYPSPSQRSCSLYRYLTMLAVTEWLSKL